MKTIARACMLMVALCLDSVPMAAHHAFFSAYDTENIITITGTVTRVEWQNPHTHFYLDVTDPHTASVSNWSWEMGPPIQLVRKGWTKSSIKIGDLVTVDGFRAKNGDTSGSPGMVTVKTSGERLPAGTFITRTFVVDYLAKQFGSAQLEECKGGAPLGATVGDLQFLHERFSQDGWEDVNEEYEANLYLLSGMTAAALNESDRNVACVTFAAVSRDIKAKRDDCALNGKGRTNLSVQIQTASSHGPVSNWEVYYRWLPDGDRFSTVWRRLEGLSAPAKGIVPVPGEYELKASNPLTGVMSAPVRVSIAGSTPFTWPLIVPDRR